MFQSHIVSGLIKCSQFTALFECIIINRVAILSFNTHHEASEDSQIQICGQFQTFHFDVCMNVEYPRSFCILWIKRKQSSDYHCEYCFVVWCLLWVVVNLAQSNEWLYFTTLNITAITLLNKPTLYLISIFFKTLLYLNGSYYFACTGFLKRFQ